MIAWPTLNGKSVGIILRSSSWDAATGVIADQTRSGNFKTRAGNIFAPDEYSITMHMTLPEYRAFDEWWKTECRRGVHTFAYPKINDNTGKIKEYQFAPDTKPNIKNTSGNNLEITMQWLEAVRDDFSGSSSDLDLIDRQDLENAVDLHNTGEESHPKT